MIGVVRRAAQLLRPRFFLAQLVLLVLVSLLGGLWLRVPDAGPVDVLLTVVLGGFLLVAAFGGEALILLRLRPGAMTRRRVAPGALALLLAVLLWMGWNMLLAHLSSHDMLRAGYLNSRAPSSTRNFFLYTSLMRWSAWLWAGLRWLGAGVLLAAASSAGLQGHGARAITCVVRSLTYWVVLGMAVLLGETATRALTWWTPGRGLPTELLSFAARMSSAICFDLLLACFVLTTIAALLEREAYRTPGGRAEVSQPRTTRSP